MRIFLLYGQFNVTGTLPSVATRVEPYGTVTTHSWNDTSVLSRAQEAVQHGSQVALIGFSLGANESTYMASRLPSVALLVAYDPSRRSPKCEWDDAGAFQRVGGHVRRAMCYFNPPSWRYPDTLAYGGAQLRGPHVEIIQVSESHILGIPNDENLHQRTIAAVKAVAQPESSPVG